MKHLLLLSLLLSSVAYAEDVDAPVRAEKPARKKFYVRAGVAHIEPFESSNEMELADVDGPASLAVQNGPIAGSGATMSSATIPSIIVGYVLPWGDGKLSVETILGLPFKVTFQATGTLATESIAPEALGLPTGVPALGPELGEARAVPIVLTAVYQVASFGRATPFVGGGATMMFATEEKLTNMQLTAIGQPEMSIAPAPGLVLQAGIDAMITNRIYARLDMKFIAFLMARATVKHVEVSTPDLPLFESAEVGTAKMNMWVNPFIVQLGIGTDF